MILKVLALTVGVTVAVLTASPLFAQTLSLSTDWLLTGLSFNDCMRHAERVLGETGFGSLKTNKDFMSGTYGSDYAQIMCLPNRVVVFIAFGTQASDHLGNLKRTFVNLRVR
jgi:hypothetical protein